MLKNRVLEYLRILGIPTDVDFNEEDINRNFKMMANLYHPDKNKINDNGEKFKRLQEAKDFLLSNFNLVKNLKLHESINSYNSSDNNYNTFSNSTIKNTYKKINLYDVEKKRKKLFYNLNILIFPLLLSIILSVFILIFGFIPRETKFEWYTVIEYWNSNLNKFVVHSTKYIPDSTVISLFDGEFWVLSLFLSIIGITIFVILIMLVIKLKKNTINLEKKHMIIITILLILGFGAIVNGIIWADYAVYIYEDIRYIPYNVQEFRFASFRQEIFDSIRYPSIFIAFLIAISSLIWWLYSSISFLKNSK